jgi:hypothetical protein
METYYTIMSFLALSGIIFPILYYFEYKKSTKAFNEISKLQMKIDVLNAIGTIFANKLYVLREKGCIPDILIPLFKNADNIASDLRDLIPEIDAEEKIQRGGIPIGIPDVYFRSLLKIKDIEKSIDALSTPLTPEERSEYGKSNLTKLTELKKKYEDLEKEHYRQKKEVDGWRLLRERLTKENKELTEDNKSKSKLFDTTFIKTSKAAQAVLSFVKNKGNSDTESVFEIIDNIELIYVRNLFLQYLVLAKRADPVIGIDDTLLKEKTKNYQIELIAHEKDCKELSDRLNKERGEPLILLNYGRFPNT